MLPAVRNGSSDVAVAAAEQSVIQEVQGAMIIAQRFPRDEDVCRQRMLRICQRQSFAADAEYSFPRGGQTIHGPSVYFAREVAKVWTNLRHGFYVVADSDTERTIRSWAWDLESNTKVESEDIFKKLIYRKGKGWIVPDERELRELTNRRAAIAKRNCILELIPSDFVDDMLAECTRTVEQDIADDPEKARKSAVDAFTKIRVPIEELKQFISVSDLNCLSPSQIATLRQVYASIRDGQSSWSDYYSPSKEDDQVRTKDDLKERLRKSQQTQDSPLGKAKKKGSRNEETSEAPVGSGTTEQRTPNDTDPVTGEQLATLAELCSRSAEIKARAEERLRQWNCLEFAELNHGTAKELIKEILEYGRQTERQE